MGDMLCLTLVTPRRRATTSPAVGRCYGGLQRPDVQIDTNQGLLRGCTATERLKLKLDLHAFKNRYSMICSSTFFVYATWLFYYEVWKDNSFVRPGVWLY